ncbi:MAG: ArsR/SmtB family transcription factor [Candidatus Ornithomonoglobus sp.]
MKNKYAKTAEIFKSFCDENRIRILEMLQTGEKCGCKLLEELNVTQPTLSHHMKILCDAGIVDSRKEGKWTHYKISNEGRNDIIKLLEEITKINSSCADNCCN